LKGPFRDHVHPLKLNLFNNLRGLRKGRTGRACIGLQFGGNFRNPAGDRSVAQSVSCESPGVTAKTAMPMLSGSNSRRSRGSLFQVSGPVGDQGEGFGDGLRQYGVHHEFLAVGGNGVGSLGTAHGGGFEQGVGCA